MLKNYFLTAIRNLWKRRGFSALNIAGLTAGMAAFYLIFLYVRFELSYDSFHAKADRIYRIVSDVRTPSETLHYNAPPLPVPDLMPRDLPEVELTTRVGLGDNWMVIRGDQVFEENDVASADTNFFRVFDFPLLRGDRFTALSKPQSVVLSESTAKKFFGNTDPMGQTMLMTREKIPGIVTGVMKDFPENSHIKASMVYSIVDTGGQKFGPNDWENDGFSGYVLLKPGASPSSLESKLPAFMEKWHGPAMIKKQKFTSLHLEPLRDVYLRSTRDDSKTGHIANVYIFSIVGAFILLIAAINFVNLTTARSAERAKEVGIRKVVGAGKTLLAGQFIGESIILCLIAFLLAICLAGLLLPAFNLLAGKNVSQGIFTNLGYLLILLSIAVLIGIAAGIYPALVLSSFRPVAVLKGRFSTGTRGLLLRKGLVILQFAIASAMIVGTLVVYNQLHFMRSQELGFSRDQELVLDLRGDSSRFAFRREIAALTGVASTAMSSTVPGTGTFDVTCEIENAHGAMQLADVFVYLMDFDYLKQFGISMAAGRAFSTSFSTDTLHAMILNETAVRLLGYETARQAIGKKFSQFGNTGQIIGVVKDFHFRSLQEPIKPLALRVLPRDCDLLCVKIAGTRIPELLSTIGRKWKQMLPERPFTYFFLDETFDKQYRAEEQFGTLFLFFAVLAIVISCLGLMGLASYSTLQRTKEIGVRKVVGASVAGIVVLLSKDFLKLVVLSFLISTPFSWYFAHGWLRNFAYRIDSYGWIFVVGALTALFIAVLTVSYQAIRAAMANPIKSLRTE